jgi:hypothetical protein
VTPEGIFGFALFSGESFQMQSLRFVALWLRKVTEQSGFKNLVGFCDALPDLRAPDT